MREVAHQRVCLGRERVADPEQGEERVREVQHQQGAHDPLEPAEVLLRSDGEGRAGRGVELAHESLIDRREGGLNGRAGLA